MRTGQPPASGASGGCPPAQVLRERRRRLGRTQGDLIRRMQQTAARQGVTLPTPASLKSMISRWEQGQHRPDRQNRKVLAAALGIPESTLDDE